MNNLAPSHVSSDEVPEGFTKFDPNRANGGGGNNEAELKKQAIKEQKQMILEQAMDSSALARLGRIRMVKPEKAASVENMIVSMVVQGKLSGKITEGKLIEILERSSRSAAKSSSGEGSSGSIQIQRKRYAMDSDDEEDDDDDI